MRHKFLIISSYSLEMYVCKLTFPILTDVHLKCYSKSQYRLMEEPAAYGKLGLANLLELREECLREFHFTDAYITIKQRWDMIIHQ